MLKVITFGEPAASAVAAAMNLPIRMANYTTSPSVCVSARADDSPCVADVYFVS